MIILGNSFLVEFLKNDLINSMIVMVTVTLPVGYTLVEKAKEAKREVKRSTIPDESKISINDEFDTAIDRIRIGSNFMVVFLILSLLVLFLHSTVVAENSGVKSFLLGSSLYMFIHSIILMVEMYRALYDWWSPKDES